MMKTTAFVLCLTLAAVAHADVIHLTSGKDLNGFVTGYSMMTFTIAADNGGEVRQSAAAIKSITFSPRSVKFEVRGRPAIEGNVTAFENSAFTVQQADGKTETVQAMTITAAKFSGSAKKYMLISGGGPLDLKKVIAPGRITVLFFFLESNAQCKTAASQLDKIIKDDPDVVLRKVDVVKLSTTAVSKQFDIKGVPRTHIYDRKGKEIGKVTGAGMDAVNTYLKVAKESK
jgi:uncharacterized protein YxjI